MTIKSSVRRIGIKNILYLTDFSEPSEFALPYASELARGYNANIHVLHILLPTLLGSASPELTQTALEVSEERAKEDMQRIESQLAGVQHESAIERSTEIWTSVAGAIKARQIDLVVLGTHGRTGTQRLLLGSVAEEIFRRSPIPVMTIGPNSHTASHQGAKFHRVVMAMDFNEAALAALPYALSIAEENQAHIYLLHVIPQRHREAELGGGSRSVSESMHRLHDLWCDDDKLWCRPHALVRYGNAAAQILDASRELGADLIVLGVQPIVHHLCATTQVMRMTAHEVVARARCPVLSVASLLN